LKSPTEQAVIQVVIATGISSVVTQLLTIREFLTQFRGNEIVIALILFNWLVLGGIGTLMARVVAHRIWRATPARLGWLSLCLMSVSAVQILAIRMLRDVFFIYGSSVGFYPTWLYTLLTTSTYCLLLGFVLPYSLFVLRNEFAGFSATKIYITDNIGDISGGVVFSFALVYLVSPLQAILIAHLPMLAATYILFPAPRRRRPLVFLGTGAATSILVAGVIFETTSLTPAGSSLAFYRETRYGRIAVHQDGEQFTLFQDGTPVFSNQNISIAEESIHYPLAQLENARHVLMVSAESGVMEELQKYRLQSVDYVELDPEVTAVQFRYKMIKNIPELNVIHQDGRAFLAESNKIYDAIIVSLPEPDTFQINRFYTDRFFELAKNHLTEEGVLSFSLQGFENYLAEPQRQKLSSLYNTAQVYFEHVTLLPGQKVFFLCRNAPVGTDIPAMLDKQGISTTYINGFYYGNLTPERIDRLNRRMDPSTPINRDNSPFLMRVMFTQWFAKYQSSPVGFIITIVGLTALYLLRVSRPEFVLFSTGCSNMGCEILVIFAFQIFFGYIYLQIGIIITVFLAGLLPGAWIGNRLREKRSRILALTDVILILLLGTFIVVLLIGGDRLPVSFYLVFGFSVSLVCGVQFPVALALKGSGNAAASRMFSADLVGAAWGTLFTSLILIPFFGIIWATTGLILIKLASLAVIGVSK
jgi:spermidine synthase